MPASATSRIATAHAAYQPPHGANANKADDTSPFALLLASAASAKDVKGQKAPAGDKDGQDETTANQPAATGPDTQADATSAQAQTQTQQPQADAKAVAAGDKEDGTANKEDGTAKPDAAADSAMADPSALPQAVMLLQQQAAIQQSATAQTDEAGDDTIDAAAAVKGGKQAAPAPAAGDKDAGTNVEDAQTPQAAAAQAKSADGKSDTAKPDSKSAVKAASKGDDGKAEADDVKANAQAAAAPAPAAGDKPAAHAPDNAITAPALATANPPQAPAAASVPAQHVQVTAQPAPNLPALAVEIAAKSQAGSKQFDIRLDPPELGRVEVRLSIDATGKASAHLTADQPQTLDLLQRDSTNLTRALRDAGLNVNPDGLNFSLRQQAGDTHQGQGGGGRSVSRGRMLSASKSLDATQASAAIRAPADGRLDIKV